jgi:hypothetical protein
MKAFMSVALAVLCLAGFGTLTFAGEMAKEKGQMGEMKGEKAKKPDGDSMKGEKGQMKEDSGKMKGEGMGDMGKMKEGK